MNEKGKLLIVEDNPGYAARARDAIPGDLLFAFDLEQARAYLAEGGLSGVITDMNFARRGLYGSLSGKWNSHNPLLYQGISVASDHPIFSHPSYLDAQKASVCKTLSSNYVFEPTVIAEEGEKRVILEKLLENRPLLRKIRRAEAPNVREETINEEIRNLEALLDATKSGGVEQGVERAAYGDAPFPFIDHLYPLGFFVIEEAKRQELPVVTVTSPAHSGGSLVLLAALGMADEFSLVNAFSVLNSGAYSREALLGNVMLGKSEKAYAQAYGHLQRLGLKSSMQ